MSCNRSSSSGTHAKRETCEIVMLECHARPPPNISAVLQSSFYFPLLFFVSFALEEHAMTEIETDGAEEKKKKNSDDLTKI